MAMSVVPLPKALSNLNTFFPFTIGNLGLVESGPINDS